MWHETNDSILKQNGLQHDRECLQIQTASASRVRTLKWTFGWKIFVLYRTEGGTSGYCSGTLSSSSKVPPSKGVSAGPCGTTVVGECTAQACRAPLW